MAKCKTTFGLLIGLVWLIGIAGRLHAQQLAFELPDHQEHAVVVQPGQSRLTVICFLGTQCPMAKAYAGTLNQLHRDYADNGVRVLGIMSNRQDSLKDIRQYVKDSQAEFQVLVDTGHRVADRYGATRTPEAYLLDEQLKLRYHGRIDDQYAPGVAKASASRQDLRIAIQQLLAGKPVTVRETRALGCIIGREKSTLPAEEENPEQLTFHRDIYPLLRRHCIECHQAGEIGPFPMNSYQEVVGWADTMMETMDDGRMPPWHADPAHGSFANERILPDEDKELFRAWIEQGAAEGNRPAKQIAQKNEPKRLDGWQFPREPDLILPMRDRPFTVPKDGVVEYQYFVVDPGFDEDKWVQAAQVMPGSRDVVHHAIVFIRPPDGARFRGVGWLGGYVPGQRALELKPGQARFLPAGSKLVFQMHYTPVGRQRDDVTQVGLLFADPSEVTHSVYTLLAIDQEFEIPPRSAAHQVQASLSELPAAGQLLAITPHMHVRGKSFELTAELASAASDEILLRVPDYDFNWQHTYQFADPLPLPDLNCLRFTATFDNSDANPFNPDPGQWVTWGDQTWEEMAVAFFEVAVPIGLESQRGAVQDERSLASDRLAKIEAYVSTALNRLDRNGDGVIRKSEVEIIVRRRFWQWDQNDDQLVTKEELRQAAQAIF